VADFIKTCPELIRDDIRNGIQSVFEADRKLLALALRWRNRQFFPARISAGDFEDEAKREIFVLAFQLITCFNNAIVCAGIIADKVARTKSCYCVWVAVG